MAKAKQPAKATKATAKPAAHFRILVAESVIIFFDSEPGSHATLFADGRRLAYLPEQSAFNDADSAYEWAFELRPAIEALSQVDGVQFVFATADRCVVGIAEGYDRILPIKSDVQVERDADGKPVGIAD